MFNFRGIYTYDSLTDFPSEGDEKYYYVDLLTEKIYTYIAGVYTERFSGGGGGSVVSVSGTTDRITSTGGANPIIDISAVYDATKENSANKSTTTADSGSAIKFPVWSAIVSYITTAISVFTTKANNLSDLVSVKIARVNLGIDKITNIGDANYTILDTDKTVATNVTFTAPRTWTLPAPNSVNAGYEIIVSDLFGSVTSTNTLTISGAINGGASVVIGAQFGARRFISNGVDKYTVDAGVMRVSDYIGTTLTASKVVVTDANSKLAPSGVSVATLNFLDATSSIQTQLNAKQATLVSGTNIKTINGAPILGSGDIVVSGGAGVVGTLNVNTTAVGNIGIGEDDLITYSVGANVLATNQDYITFEGSGSFSGSINSKRIKIKFGATTIFDSGMLAVTSAAEWVIEGSLIRTSATTFKANVRLNSSFASLAAYADYTTGTETFSVANIIKLTGEATVDNDIVQEFLIVKLNSNTTDALLSYATKVYADAAMPKSGVFGSFISGQAYSGNLNATAMTNQVISNGDVRCGPVVFRENFDFTKIRFNIATIGTATFCKVYIFDSNSLGYPNNTPVYTSADTAIATAGLKEITTSYTFLKNTIYWVLFHVNGSVTPICVTLGACYNLGDSSSTGTFSSIRTIIAGYPIITNFTTQVGTVSATRSNQLPVNFTFLKA